MNRSARVLFLGLILAFAAGLAGPAAAQTQKRPNSIRDFLLQYRGKEIQIMDRTGGSEQFVGGDPTKTYVLTLVDVQSDHIIVSRNTSGDKRSFLYPISVIRRIIFAYEGKPYQMILLEMY
jgi:hypothetical protein